MLWAHSEMRCTNMCSNKKSVSSYQRFIHWSYSAFLYWSYHPWSYCLLPASHSLYTTAYCQHHVLSTLILLLVLPSYLSILILPPLILLLVLPSYVSILIQSLPILLLLPVLYCFYTDPTSTDPSASASIIPYFSMLILPAYCSCMPIPGTLLSHGYWYLPPVLPVQTWLTMILSPLLFTHFISAWSVCSHSFPLSVPQCFFYVPTLTDEVFIYFSPSFPLHT